MMKYLVAIAAMLLVSGTSFGATLYDFETGTEGWTFQTYADSQAISTASQSTDQALTGSNSLAGTTHLVPGDVNFSKGELLVTRTQANKLNLEGLTATVGVFGPTGAAGTNPSSSNGWQMFFKDVNYKSWYGPWQNLVENNWTTLSSTLGTTTPDFVDAGFDATQIVTLGVKIGTGGSATGVYDGPVYVDDYTVVPEPASMLLLGSGLIGIFGFARKKKA
ncbi:MAG: PEP-CTERM sorting domain-containing protein [Candidatus Omnitrophica bacterium]|nr:PEP-CTERM sorting domain-containing protein [Candidatus Omnitrophota bacterium]